MTTEGKVIQYAFFLPWCWTYTQNCVERTWILLHPTVSCSESLSCKSRELQIVVLFLITWSSSWDSINGFILIKSTTKTSMSTGLKHHSSLDLTTRSSWRLRKTFPKCTLEQWQCYTSPRWTVAETEGEKAVYSLYNSHKCDLLAACKSSNEKSPVEPNQLDSK